MSPVGELRLEEPLGTRTILPGIALWLRLRGAQWPREIAMLSPVGPMDIPRASVRAFTRLMPPEW